MKEVGLVVVFGPSRVGIWDSSGGELWTLRSLWSPVRQVCMSCTLWYSPNVKWAICVWSTECHAGSGQWVVSFCACILVYCAKSSGVSVWSACCQLLGCRRWLSFGLFVSGVCRRLW
jgi:hypothetical protein